jgi:hypothetical protein
VQRTSVVRPAQAAAWAARLMAQARAEGDPRHAGEALALLQPWASQARAPADVVVALADAEQHLHAFDAARTRLEALAQREPAQAQAWLMLATLHRLQGRWSASNAACARLLALRVQPYADACVAENDALGGRFDAARQRLLRWLGDPRAAAQRGWLAAVLGHVAELAGDDRAAERAYRMAVAAGGDRAAAIALADLLLRTGRHAQVRPLLAGQPASDAVLLRVARADPHDEVGRDAIGTLRERFRQAQQRGDTATQHARERAQAALYLDRDAAAALHWAEVNLRAQREPLDLALWLEAAVAAGDAAAQRRARAAVEAMGRADARFAQAR